MTQILSACYRLRQAVPVRVELQGKEESTVVGLGEVSCDGCEEQAFRGCALPGQEAYPGEIEWVIDNTGDVGHDRIRFCPASLPHLEPLARATVQTFCLMQAAGGPGLNWSGAPIADQPERVAWTWGCLSAIKSRFEAEIREAREDLRERLRRRG